ncbi:MFS transporter [Kistimonas scapharcae]|uniref:MFS transporter n=1 Tax=Kistimonas scapharcae TaxID=1036133 RepID=A0ABP8V956_9GAMM
MQGDYRYPIIATAAGGAIEMYDFSIFLFLSDYLSAVFLPLAKQGGYLAAGLMVTGYIARPLGGIMFGYLGDCLGRKKTFLYSLMLMSIATFGIALLPDASNQGIVAYVWLMVFRVLQGVSAGGEIPLGYVFVSENSNHHNRGCVVAQFGAGCEFGYLAGFLCCQLLMLFLSDKDIVAWGWRLLFLFGGAMGGIAYAIRLCTLESRGFLDASRNSGRSNFPPADVVVHYYREILTGIGIALKDAGALACLLSIYKLFPSAVGLSGRDFLSMFVLSLSIGIPFIIIGGKLSDMMGRKWIIHFSAMVTGLLSALGLLIDFLPLGIFFWLFVMSVAVFSAFGRGVYPRVVLDSFPTRLRCSGFALSYNVGFALFTALGVWLSGVYAQYSFKFPLCYMLCCSLVAFMAARRIPERHTLTISHIP